MSLQSQDSADVAARRQLALMINIRIRQVTEKTEKEIDDKSSQEYRASVVAISDVELSGIAITERFYDQMNYRYYSLIKIGKTEYDKIVVEEKRRAVERQKGLNLAAEQQKEEELRKRQKELDLQRQADEQAKKEEEYRRAAYAEFLKMTPPEKVVFMENAELFISDQRMIIKGGLFPVTPQMVQYAFRVWRMEISATGNFLQSKVEQGEFALKLQLVSGAGEFTKIAIALGYAGYSGSISKTPDLKKLQLKQSPLLALNMTFPELGYSITSLNVDARRIMFGINSFILHPYLGEKISFICEVDWIWDREFRNRFNDGVVANGGINFRASEGFGSSITYENNEFIVLTLSLYF
jgi:hypothetical protein